MKKVLIAVAVVVVLLALPPIISRGVNKTGSSGASSKLQNMQLSQIAEVLVAASDCPAKDITIRTEPVSLYSGYGVRDTCTIGFDRQAPELFMGVTLLKLDTEDDARRLAQAIESGEADRKFLERVAKTTPRAKNLRPSIPHDRRIIRRGVYVFHLNQHSESEESSEITGKIVKAFNAI